LSITTSRSSQESGEGEKKKVEKGREGQQEGKLRIEGKNTPKGRWKIRRRTRRK
jgi:hypothetical protein